MFKKSILAVLLMAAVSEAAVEELIPKLTSEDFSVQTQARLDLLAVCSNAGRPGYEEERRMVCEEICGILEKGGPEIEVMQPLIRNLGRIGAEESVPALAKLLNHKNQHVRDDARGALTLNPSRSAAEAIAAQLKMRKVREPGEIAGLINALGERRERDAVNIVAVQFSHNDDMVYISAVKALGRIGGPAAIRKLAEQRARAHGYRLMQINAELFATDHKEVFEKLYDKAEPIEVRQVALLGLSINGGLSVASSAMASGDQALQAAVVEAALQSRDSKLYSLLAASLKNLSPALQVRTLTALEFSGTDTYARMVEPLLGAEYSAEVQDAASRALARIGTANSVEPLLANGRADARRALGMLNVDGVDAMLEKAAANAGDSDTRVAAIDALANRGRKDLIPTLIMLGEVEDRAVASAAVTAIGKIGGVSNVEALTDLMIARENSPVSRDALNAIVKVTRETTTPEVAVNVLVKKMENASPRSRSNILKALAQTGSDAALEPLQAACYSTDEQLQKTAVKALGGWPNVNGIPVMLEVAANEATSLANHVVLMRGISRISAAQPARKYTKADLQPAIDACRRQEERLVLRALQDKLSR